MNIALLEFARLSYRLSNTTLFTYPQSRYVWWSMRHTDRAVSCRRGTTFTLIQTYHHDQSSRTTKRQDLLVTTRFTRPFTSLWPLDLRDRFVTSSQIAGQSIWKEMPFAICASFDCRPLFSLFDPVQRKTTLRGIKEPPVLHYIYNLFQIVHSLHFKIEKHCRRTIYIKILWPFSLVSSYNFCLFQDESVFRK